MLKRGVTKSIAPRSPYRKKHRDAFKRQIRRKAAAVMYAREVPQAQIAAKLGVNQKTISNDLGHVMDDLKQATRSAAEVYRQRQIDRLDKMEAQVWEEWHRSKMAATQTRVEHDVKTVPDPNDPSRTVQQPTGTGKLVRTNAERIGDPRFVAQLLAIEDMRAKLMGTYAAPKPAALEFPDEGGAAVSPSPNVLLIKVGGGNR